ASSSSPVRTCIRGCRCRSRTLPVVKRLLDDGRGSRILFLNRATTPTRVLTVEAAYIKCAGIASAGCQIKALLLRRKSCLPSGSREGLAPAPAAILCSRAGAPAQLSPDLRAGSVDQVDCRGVLLRVKTGSFHTLWPSPSSVAAAVTSSRSGA